MASTRFLTRATLVEGECCHHCATLLYRMMLESKYSQIPVNTDTEGAIQSVGIKRLGCIYLYCLVLLTSLYVETKTVNLKLMNSFETDRKPRKYK